MEWRHHFHTSPVRLTRIASVGAIVFLILWALPSIARVDFLRPQIVSKLQALTGRSVSVGHVYVRALPRPGLIATDITVFDSTDTAHPLLSVHQVGLRFYARPLLSLHLRLLHITLNAPHFYLRRLQKTGTSAWSDIAVMSAPSTSPNPYPVQGVATHQGEIDFTDETVNPPLHLSLKSIEVTHDLIAGRGTLEAEDPALGSESKILITYDKNSPLPLHILMGHVSTRLLIAYMPAAADWLNGGSFDLDGVGRAPAVGALPNHLVLNIQDWRMKPLLPITLAGRVSLSTETVHLDFHTQGAIPESYLAIKSPWPRDAVTVRASLTDLSPEIAQLFSFSSWLIRLRGHGHIDAQWRYPSNTWQATARGFELSGTAFHMTRVTCTNDASELHVHVEAADAPKTVRVEWVSPTAEDASALTVDATSVTVRDILQVFDVPTTTTSAGAESGARHFLLNGYQDVTLQSAHFESTFTPEGDLDITHAQATMDEGQLTATGEVNLSTTAPHMAFQGSYQQWPVQAMIRRFVSGDPILDGTGAMSFDLQTEPGEDWLKKLTGQIRLQLTKGILFEFKNFYRIESLIDFSNYFKLRAPDVAARGVPFDNLAGTLTFTNGVMTTKDLFLSSPDIKIAAHGMVDFPAQRIDATVEFQILRFVEDVLTHIPGLQWAFKGGRKIILPIPVRLKGPFNNVSAS